MKRDNELMIETIKQFCEYITNNNIDTSLLSEWSKQRDVQLDDFMKFCYDNGFVPGDYDSQNNKAFMEEPAKIPLLNLEESRKLLGYIIRSEYWGGGLYAKSINDGLLIILLKRIVFLLSECTEC